jgi:hypothetical protein
VSRTVLIALGAVVVLLVANEMLDPGTPLHLPSDRWISGSAVLLAMFGFLRERARSARRAPAPKGQFDLSTYQRRRWTSFAFGVAALLLWADAKWNWVLPPDVAGISAAVAVVVFLSVFAAIGPSADEMRAYRDAQRQGRGQRT